MRRKVIEPANVSGAALAELKNWLGISRPNEDALLSGLLLASLDACEAYIGKAPLSQLVEENLPARRGSHGVFSAPFQAFLGVDAIASDGSRTPLPQHQYDIDIEPSGDTCINVLADVEGRALAVQLRVGLASNWENIPAALKQGIIRLAAHQYRDRDRPARAKKDLAPPMSVIALWRPWRPLRLT